jgi:hypothetical protein
MATCSNLGASDTFFIVFYVQSSLSYKSYQGKPFLFAHHFLGLLPHTTSTLWSHYLQIVHFQLTIFQTCGLNPSYTLQEPKSVMVYTKALHWVPIPMPTPTHTHGFWVGMGAMLLFMGGHGCNIIVNVWAWWALVLCILASNSKSESNFSDAGNTLIKKRSKLKPTTMNNFLFVWSNQDLV